jgi:hypothetical protein
MTDNMQSSGGDLGGANFKFDHPPGVTIPFKPGATLLPVELENLLGFRLSL